jgi:diacylglycerol kinase (ATP)
LVPPVNRIWNACINTWSGLHAAARSEQAFRQELAVFALAVPAAFLIAAEPWKRFLLIAAILLILIVELLNTAVEKLCDHVAPKRHARIKDVKDMGSAAVGLSLALAGAAWLLAAGEWMAALI